MSGIGAGMLSLYMKLMLGSPTGTVGASGAIFGLDGLLLAMVLFYRRPMPMVTPLSFKPWATSLTLPSPPTATTQS